MLEEAQAKLKRSAAKALLDINAVNFTVESPVRFTSGIHSPMYIDNRTLIFHPDAWSAIVEGFESLISNSRMEYDILAGVAVGGVTHCSALAYKLQKPSVFIRKEAKKHGLKKLIEGGEVAERRVLLVEDHITTGGSSLHAVEELRKERAEVVDVISIISYEFAEANSLFANHGLRLHTLTDMDTLLDLSVECHLINEKELATIRDWLATHRAQ